jgi:hypothetical protein
MPRVDKCPDCGHTSVLQKCSVCGGEACEEGCQYTCDICQKRTLCMNCIKAQAMLFNHSAICGDCGPKIAKYFAEREAAA